MDYNSLTKEQLITHCRNLGIRPCNQNMTKKKIIKNIMTFNDIDELAAITGKMEISSDEEMEISNDYDSLTKLTKRELMNKCKNIEVNCNTSMKKNQLIDLILYETDSGNEDDIPGWIDDMSINQLESIRRDLLSSFKTSERMLWVFWDGGDIKKEFPKITEENKERFKLFFTRYLEKIEQ